MEKCKIKNCSENEYAYWSEGYCKEHYEERKKQDEINKRIEEEDLKAGKFEIPTDVVVRLTEQDVQHLKETKKLDYFTDLLIKIKLVKS